MAAEAKLDRKVERLKAQKQIIKESQRQLLLQQSAELTAESPSIDANMTGSHSDVKETAEQQRESEAKVSVTSRVAHVIGSSLIHVCTVGPVFF